MKEMYTPSKHISYEKVQGKNFIALHYQSFGGEELFPNSSPAIPMFIFCFWLFFCFLSHNYTCRIVCLYEKVCSPA